MNALSFEDVSKTYKSHPFHAGMIAVRHVSLEIPTGCVFGLLGPNRAGKTTLVKMLLSLAKPTAGQVQRLGEPAHHRRTLARVGYMHENHAFPRYLSAQDVLQFYGGLAGVRTEVLNERVQQLLERVGLSDRKNEPITRFSKGMVQRLGLAQALLNDPELLILDEPTEGLDLQGRQLLREVVREFRQSQRTVLLVSHVLSEVEELCEPIAVLRSGEVAYRGSVAELKQTGRSLELALQDIYAQGTAA